VAYEYESTRDTAYDSIVGFFGGWIEDYLYQGYVLLPGNDTAWVVYVGAEFFTESGYADLTAGSPVVLLTPCYAAAPVSLNLCSAFFQRGASASIGYTSIHNSLEASEAYNRIWGNFLGKSVTGEIGDANRFS